MLVLHANWTDGALCLWAESLDGTSTQTPEPAYETASEVGAGGVAVRDAIAAHPFAASAAELGDRLRAGGLLDPASTERARPLAFVLRLPATNAGPAPSDRLRGMLPAPPDEDEDEGVRLVPTRVPALALPEVAALETLLHMEDVGPGPDVEFGHALRYWMRVARFVVELLADQRFIPSLVQPRGAELRGAWQPWLHDDAARERVGALVAGMPPVVRAVTDDAEGRPWPILDSALSSLVNATVRRALAEDDFFDAIDGRDPEDPHVAWLAGLLGTDEAIGAAAPGNGNGGAAAHGELLRDVGRWIARLDDVGRDRPFRLALRLDEPPDDAPDTAPWRLGLHLASADEPPMLLQAEEIWNDPAAAQSLLGRRVRNPEEVLLAELGRAALVYPALDAALRSTNPTGIDLDAGAAYTFLTEYREPLAESGFVVQVPDWWGRPSTRLTARLHVEAPELEAIEGGGGASAGEAGIASAGRNLLGLNSLVKYRWQVAIGDRVLGMDEFQALARSASGGSLVRLDDRWVEVDPDELREAAAYFGAQAGGEMTLLEAVRLAHGASATGVGLPVNGLDATGWVADLLGASTDDTRMARLAQPERFLGELRPYQGVGLSWLSFLDRFGLGACLADDMGLGKTIQLIALLQHERARAAETGGRIGTTLLIVPTSVVSNWQRELHRFAPELSVHIHHGPERPLGDRFLETAADCDVAITTYTLISRDRDTLLPIHWHRVVLDEAQYIKNPPTKQTSTIRALQTTRRIALTGTPVENRLSELWSIMEFCNPGYLGQQGEFRRRFAIPVERHRDQHRAEQLRRLVRPFVLRRLKTDPTVIDDLPPCVVTREDATLTGEQARLYEKTVNEMLAEVARAEGIQRRGLVLAALVKLKQICNHPAQLAGELPTGTRAEREAIVKNGVEGVLSRRSGKAARTMEMLEEVLATGDKALVFTQFRRMGHLLEAMIRHDLDTDVLFLHGGTPPAKRQQMIDRFQDPDGGVPIFILSLKAGGVGLNLTAANHVFHYDRWWNPAVENQATDRAFRIGQTRTVHVHKFVCLGTLEERIDQMIEQKTELAQNIIGAGEDWLTEMSTGQLREMLTLRDSAMELQGDA